MNLKILDCTLRDGGYCNDWKFGKENKKRIISSLVNAKVDIIECGYVTNKVEYNEDSTKYTKFSQIDACIPISKDAQKYVVMINYGEYQSDEIPLCAETKIDGIRVAFHKKNMKPAMEFCSELKRKGYLIFVQPMVTLNYDNKEFVDLLKEVTKLTPYAFYIVDSFGTMKPSDVLHYFDLIKKNLDNSINVGFHSHNNMQLALLNAECIMNASAEHKFIVDSSIYGMGRGAGNLNTELLLNEVNGKINEKYLVKPLLICMDEIIHRFYKEKPWGYSLPNYLSAIHMVHPNYAIYLSEKNTLTVDAIDDIFSKIEADKAMEFDADYIENLYLEYMSQGCIYQRRMDEIKKKIKNKRLLIIAPGKSTCTEDQKIKDYIHKEKPIVISVNHEYADANVDYVFVSNMRRFKQIPGSVYSKIIATSNINSKEVHAIVKYYSLINPVQSVRDNSGLMAIRLFMNLGVNSICLAGYDGYDYLEKNNYENIEMSLIMDKEHMDLLNKGMKIVLDEYQKECNLEFLTTSRFA